MEENNSMAEEGRYCNWIASSPEIVEIGDENNKSIVSSKDGGLLSNDVYVAVGKNDLHVVKYTLDHVVSPGSRVFLVHVFPPLTHISTPVGMLLRNQLSNDQMQVYIREHSNRRKNLLEKYIRVCNESKVVVDTMLVESNASVKSIILELISVANITHLVMGTKQSPFITRLSRSGLGKGKYVKRNAPEFCELTLVVYDGKKMKDGRQVQTTEKVVPGKSNIIESSSSDERLQQEVITRQHSAERNNFFECANCFPRKFI